MDGGTPSPLSKEVRELYKYPIAIEWLPDKGKKTPCKRRKEFVKEGWGMFFISHIFGEGK
ncbi:MAG: hypothetical protein Kow0090_02090 [Myxococcota bacterium]